MKIKKILFVVLMCMPYRMLPVSAINKANQLEIFKNFLKGAVEFVTPDNYSDTMYALTINKSNATQDLPIKKVKKVVKNLLEVYKSQVEGEKDFYKRVELPLATEPGRFFSTHKILVVEFAKYNQKLGVQAYKTKKRSLTWLGKVLTYGSLALGGYGAYSYYSR